MQRFIVFSLHLLFSLLCEAKKKNQGKNKNDAELKNKTTQKETNKKKIPTKRKYKQFRSKESLQYNHTQSNGKNKRNESERVNKKSK